VYAPRGIEPVYSHSCPHWWHFIGTPWLTVCSTTHRPLVLTDELERVYVDLRSRVQSMILAEYENLELPEDFDDVE